MRPPDRATIRLQGQRTEIRVARFTRDQSFAFRTALNGHTRRQARTNAARDAAEEAGDVAAIEATNAAADKEQLAAEDFARDMVRQYISFDPGHVDDRGQPVETGDQILAAYGDHYPTIGHLFNEIAVSNTWTEIAKNDFRSRHAFGGGSDAASPARSGQPPASTVDPASASGSKESAGA